MKQSAQPLAEVFGHLISDQTPSANRYRSRRLCPFNNKVPNCTKDKAKNPLGVCSVFHDGAPVITCPIRFREDWLITDDAASFFFPEDATWSSLTEVRLNDANGKSAGNIDIVLVSYDQDGKVLDFGALEIQAVYISGNVREPFEYFMKDPKGNAKMDWSDQPNYPRPDYLSSSRKRLAPQLLFKGGILHSWGKKCAVALNKSFFDTLPKLKTAPKDKADITWLIYDLQLIGCEGEQRYKLTKIEEVYTQFEPALVSITNPVPGKMDDFVKLLQERLDEQLETPPPIRQLKGPSDHASTPNIAIS
ncbi:MAG: NotI family restriction endonuclease [Anaerolineales bacterium]|nr:NotI family restriction endonuclease [Anaerolineales bacterium]